MGRFNINTSSGPCIPHLPKLFADVTVRLKSLPRIRQASSLSSLFLLQVLFAFASMCYFFCCFLRSAPSHSNTSINCMHFLYIFSLFGAIVFVLSLNSHFFCTVTKYLFVWPIFIWLCFIFRIFWVWLSYPIRRSRGEVYCQTPLPDAKLKQDVLSVEGVCFLHKSPTIVSPHFLIMDLISRQTLKSHGHHQTYVMQWLCSALNTACGRWHHQASFQPIRKGSCNVCCTMDRDVPWAWL